MHEHEHVMHTCELHVIILLSRQVLSEVLSVAKTCTCIVTGLGMVSGMQPSVYHISRLAYFTVSV